MREICLERSGCCEPLRLASVLIPLQIGLRFTLRRCTRCMFCADVEKMFLTTKANAFCIHLLVCHSNLFGLQPVTIALERCIKKKQFSLSYSSSTFSGQFSSSRKLVAAKSMERRGDPSGLELLVAVTIVSQCQTLKRQIPPEITG